eukprot:8085110-Pyramimonas_sp.AAC.1
MSVDVEHVSNDTLEFPKSTSRQESFVDQLVLGTVRESEVVRGGSQDIARPAWCHEWGAEGRAPKSAMAGVAWCAPQ